MISNSGLKRSALFLACFFASCEPSSAFANGFGKSNYRHSTQCAASNDSDETEEKSKGLGTYNPLRLAVLKLGMTEVKFTSPLNYEKRPGSYDCANCGSTLFDSKGKYDSGSGWPSFWKTSNEDRVGYKREWDGRVEVTCKKCGGHLGHAFPDGPQRKDVPDEFLLEIPQDDLQTSNPDNKFTRLPRYCVNGASLKFREK
mmetsp:Transcript_1852/g.1755  ORF Transcript_1852/g.1755 Transcript_1852/m.1755 type:complete len:200 (+) Transcript_1852:101-700(+)